jgi:tetratricopeptide (TPR) repeat protein
MLVLFAVNAGRLLSKDELMEAVWPGVHVAEDSLFKCIREIRTALGDDKREMIKLISGQGYLFDAGVIDCPATPASDPPAFQPDEFRPEQFGTTARPTPPPRSGRRAIMALVGLAAFLIIGVVVAKTAAPELFSGRGPLTIAVMPITADGGLAATDVTTRLSDGLARIDNIRVAAPQAAVPESRGARPDFVVAGELAKHDESWEVRARMTRASTGEVMWSMPMAVVTDDSDVSVQTSRLAASIGQPLAQRINAMINAEPAKDSASPNGAKVVIEQAMASITRTTKERFAASQTMLEKALVDDPDNLDLAVSLAALQLRGVQMVWYTPAESAAAESGARAILERGLKRKPTYLPLLEAYCRFLNATNQFLESLVACARVLSFDPWNGLALYHIGLAQLQFGRFEEALATFKRADSFDTPPVSRWTWKLGAGMAYLLMDRSEEAVPWLQRSIAITPASGRSYMLLSAAYQGSGRPDEAKAAMEKGMALRPGTNLDNVALPSKNASPTFLAATEWIKRAYAAAGMPEH